MSEMQTLLASARNEMGGIAFYDETGAFRHAIPKPAASVACHSLRSMDMPAFAADPLRIVHTPAGTESGKKTKMSDAVLAGSRCAAAGAHILVVPAAPEPKTAENGEIFYLRKNMRFDCIEAAKFTVVPDGHDLADSALPVHRSLVNLDTMPSLGIRIPLSRAEQKSYQDGELADATVVSIALGLARAVDQVLLSAIVASAPQPFDLAKAASLGFQFSELRALIGTKGYGAGIAPDGTLRAIWAALALSNGIIAELTPDMAATVVGSWWRAAVAVHEEITLIAERIDVQGNLTLTCWCNMQALLPFPGAFWTLGS